DRAVSFTGPSEGTTDLTAEVVGVADQLHHQPIDQRRHIFFADRRRSGLKPWPEPRKLAVLVDKGIDEGLVLEADGRQARENALLERRSTKCEASIQDAQRQRCAAMGKGDDIDC